MLDKNSKIYVAGHNGLNEVTPILSGEAIRSWT